MKNKEYTTQETADELGVSVRQVYRLLDAGKIKSIKRGKKHVFSESEIDRLMSEGW
jgi:excisionase family DNA binding protein